MDERTEDWVRERFLEKVATDARRLEEKMLVPRERAADEPDYNYFLRPSDDLMARYPWLFEKPGTPESVFVPDVGDSWAFGCGTTTPRFEVREAGLGVEFRVAEMPDPLVHFRHGVWYRVEVVDGVPTIRAVEQ